MPSTAPISAVTMLSSREHPPHLAAGHPDRAEHPELARALQRRKRQRVHDAEQRHDHGQAEQGVEDPENLVHPGGLVGLELALRLELHVREGRERVLMKLGVRDRVQAVVLAYESGVVAPGATLSE